MPRMPLSLKCDLTVIALSFSLHPAALVVVQTCKYYLLGVIMTAWAAPPTRPPLEPATVEEPPMDLTCVLVKSTQHKAENSHQRTFHRWVPSESKDTATNNVLDSLDPDLRWLSIRGMTDSKAVHSDKPKRCGRKVREERTSQRNA
jgi:hypothetical protein